MLGTKTVDRSYEGVADASAWGRNPWTRGSYASAEPGLHHLREELRVPVEDRIFFAGEACHLDQWATVGGAHLSGCETAANVARVLDGQRPLRSGSCAFILGEAEPGPGTDWAGRETGGADCHEFG